MLISIEARLEMVVALFLGNVAELTCFDHLSLSLSLDFSALHISMSSMKEDSELQEMTVRTNSFKRSDSITNRQSYVSDKVPSDNSTRLEDLKPENIVIETKNIFKYRFQDTESWHSNGLNGKDDILANNSLPNISLSERLIFSSPLPITELDAAAVKLQKVYKSYRTRRNLADCAVVVEELWWKALDFAALKRSSVSFFDVEKPETAVSRWVRAKTRVAKVGKGLSKDEKARKLSLQHWLEAIDPRHRYGHNLHLYYDVWFESKSVQPFFYWLDIGAGKEVNLEICPRTKLHRQCIQYLGPKERQAYEVVVEDGRLVFRQSGMFVETIEGSKWIFVLSTSRALYVGQKKKGVFQHSSFLAGGATTAAGRLVAHEGVLEAIWPYSGHYHPTEENFREFIGFLEENHVDLTNVKRCAIDDDSPSIVQQPENEEGIEVNSFDKETAMAAGHGEEEKAIGDANVKEPVYNMANRLSCKWTTGTGPRIGCVRDYPTELQSRALEQVNLSPRVAAAQMGSYGPIPSPRPSPKVRLSPRLAYMGLPSPRSQLQVTNRPVQ